MMEFFKVIRKYNTEIGSQQRASMRQSQASSRARSTSVHKRAQGSSVDRVINRLA